MGRIGVGLRMVSWRGKPTLIRACGREGRGYGMRRGSWSKRRGFAADWRMDRRRSGIRMGTWRDELRGGRGSVRVRWRLGLPAENEKEWEPMSRGRGTEHLWFGGRAERRGRKRTIKRESPTDGGWSGGRTGMRKKKRTFGMGRPAVARGRVSLEPAGGRD